MAFNISNPIGTGTEQEILDATRAAIVQVTLHGQEYTIDGRTMRRPPLEVLQEQERIYEAKVNAAAGTSKNGVNIAKFRRPV